MTQMPDKLIAFATTASYPRSLRNLRIEIMSVVLLAGVLAGCSGEYERKTHPSGSPHWDEVSGMVAAVRSAGEAGLDDIVARQGAKNLTRPQQAGLRAMLKELATAKKSQLKSVDQWGKNVFRATITVQTEAQTRDMTVLLVRGDEKLRWAGAN